MTISVGYAPKVIPRIQVLFDPSSAQPTYIGIGGQGLSQTSAGWIVYKFNYSGTAITQIQTGIGSWSNRVSLVYS